MGYAPLAGAVAAEVAGTTAVKYSEGFTRLWPPVVTVAGYLVAFALLAQTLKTLSVAAAHALRPGVGTAAVAVIGTVFMGEGLTAAKAGGIALIIAGVVVLDHGGAHRPGPADGTCRPRGPHAETWSAPVRVRGHRLVRLPS